MTISAPSPQESQSMIFATAVAALDQGSWIVLGMRGGAGWKYWAIQKPVGWVSQDQRKFGKSIDASQRSTRIIKNEARQKIEEKLQKGYRLLCICTDESEIPSMGRNGPPQWVMELGETGEPAQVGPTGPTANDLSPSTVAQSGLMNPPEQCVVRAR